MDAKLAADHEVTDGSTATPCLHNAQADYLYASCMPLCTEVKARPHTYA